MSDHSERAVAVGLLLAGLAATSGIEASENRRIVVAFGAPGSQAMEQLQRLVDDERCRLVDRDVDVRYVDATELAAIGEQALDDAAVQRLVSLRSPDAGAFEVVLIGKDGGVKARADVPEALADFIVRIDGMPMRRAEIRRPIRSDLRCGTELAPNPRGLSADELRRTDNELHMINGKHLIAGQWVGSAETFENEPLEGPAMSFSKGTPALVDAAAQAAEAAFAAYAATPREARAVFLERIAEEIEARGAEITEIGSSETGLPAARLDGERGRTTGQLRLFADHIRKGDYLDRRHDAALPDRKPLPRPELRMMQRPIGPVGVFGASNFPLAFSTAGGDTAAALAAGCPVVVKGHSAHPGTADVVAQAIEAAIRSCGVPAGAFSQIQGGDRAVGQAVVRHPLIKAVGFTGSLGGGRALFDLCAARPEPIPFFGELGSVNPMFMLPAALAARGDDIGRDWAASLTMGAGQFCTNPGIAVVIAGPAADEFTAAATEALEGVGPQTMLTDGISSAYRAGRDRIRATTGVREILAKHCEHRLASPSLFRTTGTRWLADEVLGEEVFGPLGVIVEVDDFEAMQQIAAALHGQLTCTLHMDAGDNDRARALLPVLERKAGRILANGFPTGVEVSDTMVHGGPYPASTNFGATSVGTMSIRRFLRPVCYQNLPDAILRGDLVGN